MISERFISLFKTDLYLVIQINTSFEIQLKQNNSQSSQGIMMKLKSAFGFPQSSELTPFVSFYVIYMLYTKYRTN